VSEPARVHARAGPRAAYFVPDEVEPDAPVEPGVELGVLELESDVVPEPVVDPEVVVSVELGEDGAVDGDADGVRSAGRSLTRPLPLSVQPVASVATSARAERPSSALFMNAPPLCVSTVWRRSKPSATHCVATARFTSRKMRGMEGERDEDRGGA
jgi:hypothetical protein